MSMISENIVLIYRHLLLSPCFFGEPNNKKKKGGVSTISLHELDKNISLHLSTDRRRDERHGERETTGEGGLEREAEGKERRKHSKMALTHARLFEDTRLTMDRMQM